MKENNNIIKKYGLIVSCQAEDDDPFNNPEGVSLFAKAAELGGACAIRSEGISKTKKIIDTVNIPVIGLIKSKFNDNTVKITGSLEEVNALKIIGCSIIAIDGTFRIREKLTGPEFISKIKKVFNCRIMADISTYEEGVACYKAGADYISTTLSGYTPHTFSKYNENKPDYKLIKSLSNLSIPIIAEGRYNYPSSIKKAIEYGAWAITVGTAITRPRIITKWYINELKKI